MKLLILSLLLSATAFADAKLDGFPNKKVSVELRDVTLGKFLAIVGQMAPEVNVVADECSSAKKLNLKFKNAPLNMVIEAVAADLHLNMVFDQGTLRVSCP